MISNLSLHQVFLGLRFWAVCAAQGRSSAKRLGNVLEFYIARRVVTLTIYKITARYKIVTSLINAIVNILSQRLN